MVKCVCCGKNISEEKLKTCDAIFPTCTDCDFEKLNVFKPKINVTFL